MIHWLQIENFLNSQNINKMWKYASFRMVFVNDSLTTHGEFFGFVKISSKYIKLKIFYASHFTSNPIQPLIHTKIFGTLTVTT